MEKGTSFYSVKRIAFFSQCTDCLSFLIQPLQLLDIVFLFSFHFEASQLKLCIKKSASLVAVFVFGKIVRV